MDLKSPVLIFKRADGHCLKIIHYSRNIILWKLSRCFALSINEKSRVPVFALFHRFLISNISINYYS